MFEKSKIYVVKSLTNYTATENWQIVLYGESYTHVLLPHRNQQWMLKVEVSLYRWPPVWLVLQIKTKIVSCQLIPNQSNRRSMVQWYFPLQYSLKSVYFFSQMSMKRLKIRPTFWPPSFIHHCSLKLVDESRKFQGQNVFKILLLFGKLQIGRVLPSYGLKHKTFYVRN